MKPWTAFSYGVWFTITALIFICLVALISTGRATWVTGVGLVFGLIALMSILIAVADGSDKAAAKEAKS